MSSFTWSAGFFAGTVLAALVGAAATAPAVAQQKSALPDFSSDQVGWLGVNGGGPGFEPVPGRVPPVSSDPAHPFVPNGSGGQPTYRIADLTNPNLKPWVKEHMKKDNEEVLAGKIAFTARSSCVPAGVPGFMAFGGLNPVYFLQTPKQVWMIYSGDAQVRRIYLDVPHSANPKPSWYGESVGHYEGDTLVIDTVGLSAKTVVDPYRTPHTEKLHVVERWKMAEDRQAMDVTFTVEDPDTFNEPWSGTRRYRRVRQPLLEEVCAENNQHLFDYHIPVAEKADF
ncbi:MAG TPA: hypothetical protein VKC66_31655 [Xanthobacteraceae bacterium]|nr:hypothetical protein [Xanthobacteraceae bacterium]